jgi:hypothetical protein
MHAHPPKQAYEGREQCIKGCRKGGRGGGTDIEKGTESEIDNLLLVVPPLPQISGPSNAFAGHRSRYTHSVL